MINVDRLILMTTIYFKIIIATKSNIKLNNLSTTRTNLESDMSNFSENISIE